VLGDYVAATAGLSALTMLVLLPTSGLIGAALWNSEGATALAALSLIVVPLSAVQAALVNVLRIVRRPRAFAALTTIDLTAQLALGVAFVALGLGPTGVILGYVLGSAVGVVATGAVAWKELAWRSSFAPRIQMVRDGLNFLPAVVAFILADTIARIVVANRLGVADVGDIAVAVRLASVLLLATGAFSLAWGPIGLGLSSVEDPLFGRALRSFTTVSLLAAIAVAALGPELVALIAGGQFALAASIMPGLLVAHALTGTHFVLATAAGVSDRAASVASTSTTAAGLQIVILLVLIAPIGLAAVGISALAGRLAAAVMLGLRVRQAVAGGWIALAAVIGAAILAALALTALNLEPSQSAPMRYAIALAAGAAGSLALARSLSSRRAD
jgi:O-antigen/teichoic acid export membrane protein